jgi:hypothetical protein
VSCGCIINNLKRRKRFNDVEASCIICNQKFKTTLFVRIITTSVFWNHQGIPLKTGFMEHRYTISAENYYEIRENLRSGIHHKCPGVWCCCMTVPPFTLLQTHMSGYNAISGRYWNIYPSQILPPLMSICLCLQSSRSLGGTLTQMWIFNVKSMSAYQGSAQTFTASIWIISLHSETNSLIGKVIML